MTKHSSLFIDGRWLGGSGEPMKSENPATGETLWEGQSASTDEVDCAVTAAKVAFKRWSVAPIQKRIGYLNKFQEALCDHKDEVAEQISLEVGKPLWESKAEIDTMVNKVRISISAFYDRSAEKRTVSENICRYTRFKPLGVIVVFGPFNLPGHLPNSHIIPALLAGNTIVFKPSEHTPCVAKRVMRIWDEIGLPKGAINLVQGAKSIGRMLVSHRDIDGVFFTGSYATGKSIHETFAGKPEKILALEMGGNNPLIVMDVNDTRAAAYLTIQSAYITSGQRCVCARRLIVPNGVEGDQFLQTLIDMIGKVRIGPFTTIPEPFMGPVISSQSANHLIQAQEYLQSKGAKSLILMNRVSEQGALLCPGLIDVTNVNELPDKEFFGPLLQVIRIPDIETAIDAANRTSYGLAAGILTDNSKLYEKFWRNSRSGIVNWNRPITGASSSSPFGGIGKSGNHRPSAYFAADYCSYPVASIETESVLMPEVLTPGISMD